MAVVWISLISDTEHHFIPVGHLYVCFRKSLFSSSAHFLNHIFLLLSCVCYILHSNSLSDI